MDMRSLTINTVFALVVASLFLLAGCGSEATKVGFINDPVAEKSGEITISLQQSTGNTPAQTLSMQSPTNIRFLISNSTIGFSVLKDVTVPMTTSVSITVPVAIGYTVEAVSYCDVGEYNLILKHNALVGVDVSANTSTAINMTLQSISVSIIPPVTAMAGNKFSVSTNIPSPLYHSISYLNSYTIPYIIPIASSNITDTSGYTPMTNSNVYDLTVPTETSPGIMYFLGMFYIDPKFVSSSDKHAWQQWVYFYPNRNNGDSYITMPFTVPTGSIDLDVFY
jgi:hypothetical protein